MCFFFWGLCYTQSHSDDSHVHSLAPCSACALTQAHPTISCIPLVGASLSKPHTSEWCGKKIRCIVRTYVLVLVLITSKSLPALILQVIVSFVNPKTIHKLKLLSEKTQIAVPPRMQQQGRRPLVDLPIQWLERYGLPHGEKVSSVDANICVATSPLTLEVTSHMDRPFKWPHQ